MSLLIRDGATIRLEDHWPTQDDLGALVLLPGGEAGILTTWWHAPDHTQWRWQLEFSNTAAASVDRAGAILPCMTTPAPRRPTCGSLPAHDQHSLLEPGERRSAAAGPRWVRADPLSPA